MRYTFVIALGLFIVGVLFQAGCGSVPISPSQPATAPADWVEIREPVRKGLKIVYLCNASDSMKDKMGSLQVELQKSANGLLPIQSFDVIFVQDGGNSKHYVEFAPDLLLASEDNKKKLGDFMKNVAGNGTSHMIPGVTRAFSLPTKTDLLYILTDRAFVEEGGKAVEETIAKLNVDRKVKINTILFLGDDIDPEELKEASEDLTKIADQNGGVFTSVRISELR